ncbi:hypothetical protein GWI33_009036 [Rhynchophorus ferrugineus]|uniref:Uncharacterized protein n=1 Tax=Rhynchophorus ferrugineus TaxID=354439 RepID=A0A834MGU5_RHYFE|nr:hypothetical protein GWI33_009036 [Rhynchophorus ferrugineus]
MIDVLRSALLGRTKYYSGDISSFRSFTVLRIPNNKNRATGACARHTSRDVGVGTGQFSRPKFRANLEGYGSDPGVPIEEERRSRSGPSNGRAEKKARRRDEENDCRAAPNKMASSGIGIVETQRVHIHTHVRRDGRAHRHRKGAKKTELSSRTNWRTPQTRRKAKTPNSWSLR